MSRQRSIVVIDLEKDHLAFRFERAKVMFFMRVIGVTEVVENRDGANNSGDGLGS
jgi:hypothetical protein